MKKLLHSLLLLSLVGSAMAGMSEKDILSIARGEIDLDKIKNEIDMDEVQKTADDLLYDVGNNAAQLLINRIIKELKSKKQFLKVGQDKSEPDATARERSIAVDKLLVAMRRDLKKLENGVSDPEELETEAAKRALEEATPNAFGKKIALMLGSVAVGGLGGLAYSGYKDVQAQPQDVPGGKKIGDSLRAHRARIKDAPYKSGAAALGATGLAAGAYGFTQTRVGRQAAAKIYRGLKKGATFVASHPRAALTALGVTGAFALTQGGFKHRTGAGIVDNIKTSFGKVNISQAIAPSFIDGLQGKIAGLNSLIKIHNDFLKSSTLAEVDLIRDPNFDFKDLKALDIKAVLKCADKWVGAVSAIEQSLKTNPTKADIKDDQADKDISLVRVLRHRIDINDSCKAIKNFYDKQKLFVEAVKADAQGTGNDKGAKATKQGDQSGGTGGDDGDTPSGQDSAQAS